MTSFAFGKQYPRHEIRNDESHNKYNARLVPRLLLEYFSTNLIICLLQKLAVLAFLPNVNKIILFNSFALYCYSSRNTHTRMHVHTCAHTHTNTNDANFYAILEWRNFIESLRPFFVCFFFCHFLLLSESNEVEHSFGKKKNTVKNFREIFVGPDLPAAPSRVRVHL